MGRAAKLGQLRVQGMRELARKGHELRSLVRGVAEHNALVASANVQVVAVNMDTLYQTKNP
jgi:hypothetical protein